MAAKATRRSDAPYFPPPKQKRKSNPERRARIDRLLAIVARTRAWRAERDAFIADADTSDLEAYPVVAYPSGIAPKPPGLKRMGMEASCDIAEAAPDALPRAPIAPPVPFNEIPAPRARKPKPVPIAPPVSRTARDYRCNVCGRLGHNRTRCPESVPADEWANIDSVIASSRSIRHAALRLKVDPHTLRERLRVRDEIRARDAETATRTATAAPPAAKTA